MSSFVPSPFSSRLILGPKTHKPTQRYYHIPIPYLCTAPDCSNTLVMGDELGALDPTKVQLMKSVMQPAG